jgi:uncharacterized membrane protein
MDPQDRRRVQARGGMAARDGSGAAAQATRRRGTQGPRGASVPRAGSRETPRTSAGPATAGSAPGPGGRGGAGAGARVRAGRSGLFGIRPGPVNVKLIYAAYLASLAIPFAALLGVFVAHQALKANPTAWLATHYVFQIRTFWIGLVANLLAYAASFAGVGLLLFPLIAVWVVARSVKGLIRVAHRAPVENPNGFFV